MTAKQPKKMLIMDILEVLRKYSDAEHRLTQKQIIDFLERDFEMTADRKAVKRNLANLIDEGYPIGYRVVERKAGGAGAGEPEDASMLTDFYLEHEFTDAELRLLIDGLVFSRHISLAQRRELVGKLEGLSSVYFKSRMRHVSGMTKDRTNNAQLFLNIELLDEAISARRKVRFKYLTYGVDKKGRPRTREGGEERVYVCSPYQMAAKEDKYYLICNNERFDTASNYRVDRIVELEVTDERARPFSSLADARGGKLDLAAYMREHVYMYATGSVTCEFLIAKRMAPEVLDMFGDGVEFFDEREDSVKARARVDRLAMREYAKRYAPAVLLLSPKELADEVREDLRAALAAYEGGPVA